MGNYGMSVTLKTDHVDALERTRAALARHGFGVLTEIDLAATMKAKLGADVTPQVIIGACNPALAHRAITAEPSIGLVLPCNVVVRSVDPQHTLVEALDPQVMVQVSGNAELSGIAAEAKVKLQAALHDLAAKQSTP